MKKYLLFFVCLVSLNSCYVENCLFGPYEPTFKNWGMQSAVLNKEYKHIFWVEIQKGTFESRYDYDINVSAGELPPGIALFFDADEGHITIQGTPTKLGRFEFEVFAKAYYDESSYVSSYDVEKPNKKDMELCHSTESVWLYLDVIEEKKA